MEVVITERFILQFEKCPLEFQEAFRKIYQQLKVVDNPAEIAGIFFFHKNYYKIKIGNSRIALQIAGQKAIIGIFLYNEFFSYT